MAKKNNIVTKFQVSIFKNEEVRGGGMRKKGLYEIGLNWNCNSLKVFISYKNTYIDSKSYISIALQR